MAIWQREVPGNNGSRMTHTCTFERSYKDASGNWQSTKSFFVADLPKLRLIIDKAYADLLLTTVDSPGTGEEATQ